MISKKIIKEAVEKQPLLLFLTLGLLSYNHFSISIRCLKRSLLPIFNIAYFSTI